MNTRTLTAKLSSISPYSQSGFFASEKKPKETSADFEKRCWMERLHTDADGGVVIPQMALKYAIDEACKRLAIQVPGEGKTRYTKFMEAGYFIKTPPTLGIQAEDVTPETVWCSSTGKKGKDGGTRVQRIYGVIPNWTAEVLFWILDAKITEEVFEQSLESAGMFVGIGRFRPENQGYYGRFKVDSLKWAEA